MKKPLFIAFEGIDGSGKTTQSKLLADFFQSIGVPVHHTFEPTDSEIGKLIRKMFNHQLEADHRVIAGLFVADRLNHILNKKDGMLSRLKEGKSVITDRYYLSSYAYQGAHVSMDWVIEANRLSAELLRPDLHIFIDIEPETGLERLLASRENVELYETLENLTLVRERYMEAIRRLPTDEKVLHINGNRSEKEVADEIKEYIQSPLTGFWR